MRRVGFGAFVVKTLMRALNEKRAVVSVPSNTSLERPAHFPQYKCSIDYIVKHSRIHHPQMLMGPVSKVPFDFRRRDMIGERAVAIRIGERDVGKAAWLQRSCNQRQKGFRFYGVL